jgi:hypothetical protein
MILGGVFVVLVVIVVIGIAVSAVKVSALDKECRAYIGEVVPKVCADLRMETLSTYATPELLNSATPAESEKLFKWFKRLGEFKECKKSWGQVRVFSTSRDGDSMIGEYTAEVEFETGPAQVRIAAVKRGDVWKIRAFNIKSRAFVPE